MKIPNTWTFKSADIACNFDDHVREQLPWYDICSDAVEHIVLNYLPDYGLIYDIGCSTGNIHARIKKTIENRCARYIGIDNSKEMLSLFNEDCEKVFCDATEYDFECFDVCILFLTTMFIPASKQLDFIAMLKRKIKPGGCIIVVDKEEQRCGYFGSVLSRLTIKEKLKTTSASDILKKELSLSGIQRPLNKNIIGGKDFFRFGDFFGVIIE